MSEISGWLCVTPVYEYKGVTFEMGYSTLPWPRKKNMEPKKRAGIKFFELIDEFCTLTDDEQAKYKIQGGCIRF